MKSYFQFLFSREIVQPCDPNLISINMNNILSSFGVKSDHMYDVNTYY